MDSNFVTSESRGGAERTGRFVKISAYIARLDNSGADKQNKRRPDIRCQREHERDPMALQFYPSSIPRGNPSGETKASNATDPGENSAGNSSTRERERHNSARFSSSLSSKFKSSFTRKTIADAVIREYATRRKISRDFFACARETSVLFRGDKSKLNIRIAAPICIQIAMWF